MTDFNHYFWGVLVISMTCAQIESNKNKQKSVRSWSNLRKQMLARFLDFAGYSMNSTLSQLPFTCSKLSLVWIPSGNSGLSFREQSH